MICKCVYRSDGRCLLAEEQVKIPVTTTDDACNFCCTTETPKNGEYNRVTTSLAVKHAFDHLPNSEYEDIVEKFRHIIEEGRPILGEGPGTELKRLLERLAIAPRSGCGCDRFAIKMNEHGIEWCEQNIKQITDWMMAEARNRKFLGPLARISKFGAEAAATMLVKRALKISRGT